MLVEARAPGDYQGSGQLGPREINFRYGNRGHEDQTALARLRLVGLRGNAPPPQRTALCYLENPEFVGQTSIRYG